MLGLRFVKPGLLPVDFVKSFKVLQSRRADADCGDIETTDQAEADDAIRTAEDLFGLVEKVRKTLSA